MAYYSDDRNFTDIVHREVALSEIYQPLGMKEADVDKDYLRQIDMDDGIDYIMVDSFGKKYNVQERFREYKYHIYSDFTLRYRRDENPDKDRHESEFYKIKADYMVYGIINGSKFQMVNHEKDISFVKYAVIDLRILFERIKNGDIVLDKTISRPIIINGKLHAAINNNHDGSSSFVAFDVKALLDLFGKNIIISQKGFF